VAVLFVMMDSEVGMYELVGRNAICECGDELFV